MKILFPLFTVRKYRSNKYKDTFWDLIANAKKEILVVSPFIDSKIFEKIFELTFSKKGKIKLKMITRPPDNKIRREDFSKVSNSVRNNTFRFNLGGRNSFLWLYDTHLHMKVVVVDGKHVIFGSQNFTYNGIGDAVRADKCNNELGIALLDCEKKHLRDFQSELKKIEKTCRTQLKI